MIIKMTAPCVTNKITYYTIRYVKIKLYFSSNIIVCNSKTLNSSNYSDITGAFCLTIDVRIVQLLLNQIPPKPIQ